MTETDAAEKVRKLTFTPANAIEPSRPEWLWRGWLLLRALNLMAGRQGSGKTTFVAYIAAVLTAGISLPDDETERKPIRVAWLSLEEPDDRVAARLHAAGADLDQVLVLGDVQDLDDGGQPYLRRWSLPKDVSVLADLIVEEDIGLVIVDGLGYSISGDSHNYSVVGSALSALAGAADRTGAAILGIVHPPKGASDPVTSAIGSTAWTAIPRVSMVLGLDPNDETRSRRVVRIGKTNYAEPAHGYSFAIGNDETYECGFVLNMKPCSVSAEEIMAAPASREEKGERAEARDQLRQLLAEGPMDGAEVRRLTGISDRTLTRARSDLGVIAEQRRDGKGKVVGWTWSLPHGHSAKPTAPTESWRCGRSGYDQDFYPVSLLGGQDSESGGVE